MKGLSPGEGPGRTAAHGCRFTGDLPNRRARIRCEHCSAARSTYAADRPCRPISGAGRSAASRPRGVLVRTRVSWWVVGSPWVPRGAAPTATAGELAEANPPAEANRDGAVERYPMDANALRRPGRLLVSRDLAAGRIGGEALDSDRRVGRRLDDQQTLTSLEPRHAEREVRLVRDLRTGRQ